MFMLHFPSTFFFMPPTNVLPTGKVTIRRKLFRADLNWFMSWDVFLMLVGRWLKTFDSKIKGAFWKAVKFAVAVRKLELNLRGLHVQRCGRYVRQVAFLCMSKSLTQLSLHVSSVRMMLFASWYCCAVYCSCWSPNCLAQVGTYWYQPDEKCTERKKGVSQMRNGFWVCVVRSLHTEEFQMEVKCIGLCSVRRTDSWQELCLHSLVKLALILGSGLSKFCWKLDKRR
jgi:hypothetical protein